MALGFVGPAESENVGGPAPDGRIERAKPVRANDDGGRKPAVADPVDAADELTPARSSWCIWAASRDCARASASSTSRMTAPRAWPVPLSLLTSATV
jgi:hypothetical protein